jgi:hypothetical protein
MNVVNIDVVLYAPHFGIEKHSVPVAGKTFAFKILAEPLLGISPNQRELPCPSSCSFLWDSYASKI